MNEEVYRKEVTISETRDGNRHEVKITKAVHGISRAIRRKFHGDQDLANANVGKLLKYLNLTSARFEYQVLDIGEDYYRVTMIRRNTIHELNSVAVKKNEIGNFLARELACEISWE